MSKQTWINKVQGLIEKETTDDPLDTDELHAKLTKTTVSVLKTFFHDDDTRKA